MIIENLRNKDFYLPYDWNILSTFLKKNCVYLRLIISVCKNQNN